MDPEQRTLADAVAAQLGLKPVPGFDGHWARAFSLPDGGKLYLSTARQRGQLNISTSVADGLRDHRPYHREGEAPKTSIHVSAAKDAHRIAADIRRRLLPEYERETAACAANKARHDEFNNKRILALTKVAAPFGERVHCDERSGEPLPLSIEREGKFTLTAKPFCESVKLEVDASPEIVGRVATLLASL